MEDWCGRRWGSGLLELGVLEALTPELAKRAGELLARTGRSNAVGALVVASASQRGDVIATADPSALRELAKLVNGVDVVAV